MADIDNQEAIRFVNEVVRPKAEQLRALKAEIDAAVATWFGGLNSVIGNSADDNLIDGRESEGVSRLTGADVANLMTQLIAFQTQLNQAGVSDVISKPCVRTLDAD